MCLLILVYLLWVQMKDVLPTILFPRFKIKWSAQVAVNPCNQSQNASSRTEPIAYLWQCSYRILFSLWFSKAVIFFWEHLFSSTRISYHMFVCVVCVALGHCGFSNEIVLGTTVLYKAIVESQWGQMVLMCRLMFSWLLRSWKQWKDSKLTW